MADSLLLRAVKGQAKNLNLSNKGLSSLPQIIGKVKPLQTLVLKGNKLKDLPQEIITLHQVSVTHLFTSLSTIISAVRVMDAAFIVQKEIIEAYFRELIHSSNVSCSISVSDHSSEVYFES